MTRSIFIIRQLFELNCAESYILWAQTTDRKHSSSIVAWWGFPRDRYQASPLARWLLPSSRLGANHVENTVPVLSIACLFGRVYLATGLYWRHSLMLWANPSQDVTSSRAATETVVSTPPYNIACSPLYWQVILLLLLFFYFSHYTLWTASHHN
jgi:hypothetical protein